VVAYANLESALTGKVNPDMEDQRPPRTFRTRLTALFAANAPVSVLLRRGPKRHWRLILWDLNTDRFILGQWMKGIVELSDLSADGTKLLYRASQYHLGAARRRRIATGAPYDPLGLRQASVVIRARRPGRKVPRYLRGDTSAGGLPRPAGSDWTAIGTPPYFSALAIWPAIGRWTGGGFFEGPCKIVLFEREGGLVPIANVALPHAVKVRPVTRGELLRPSARAPAYRPQSLVDPSIWSALVDAGARNLDWVDDAATGRDLLFAADGCVYRLANWRKTAATEYLLQARLLIDLRPMSFELLAPTPDAMTW
jgi:hypothetical protein